MTEVGPLSSQLGERSEAANRLAAQRCLAYPELLAEVVQGLGHKQAGISGDCAEVMTKVAEANPALVAPHAGDLAPLLTSKTARARWEAMHALALVSHLAPDQVEPLLPTLSRLVASDPSTIVRDYATETMANLAQVRPRAAYAFLCHALAASEGKHAARALTGLGRVAALEPDLAPRVRELAQQYLSHEKGVVQKAARQALKTL